MDTKQGEEIDVDRLKSEILANVSFSALPCNMSDEWLRLLLLDITEALEHPDAPRVQRTRSALLAPMAVIVCLLFEKLNTRHVSVPLDLLREYCRRYQMELQLELVRRETGTCLVPATLETILSNRDILREVSRAQDHDASPSEISS